MDHNISNISNSRSPPFILPREWVFDKLLHCVNTRSTAKTCGLLILGSSGSGKTTICHQLINKNQHTCFKIQKLRSLLLSSHVCSSYKIDTLNVAQFIYNIHRSLLNSNIFGEIYKENIISSGNFTLFLPENLCSFPDKAFKNGILLPLLSFTPPSENMYILIDSFDEKLVSNYISNDEFGSMNTKKLNTGKPGSRSISDLLSCHHNFFPEWLSLVCTCRKENKSVIEKFLGFRKFYLDDLTKSYIVRDIQLYILNRIDNDDNLKNFVNLETTDLLNLLHIKSNGYILYLKIILDGVIDNFINIQLIKSIPGTLYGLYLWLFDVIFPNPNDYRILRHIINIILSSLTPLTEKEIFTALLNLDITIEFSLIKDLIYKAKYFLQRTNDNCLILKHNSLSDWLLDVKHCTKKYKCSLIDGHVLLSVVYTYKSVKLTNLEMRNFGFHLISSAPIFRMKGYHYAVWLLYTNCDLDIGGILPNDKFGSLYDWNFDLMVKHLFQSVSNTQIDGSFSFLIFSKYISNIISFYSKHLESNKINSTSLHESTKANDYESVSQFILKGMDVNVTNENGTTSLMIACQSGFINLCRLLLSVGALQFMTDQDGWTPLRLSIWNGHKAIVEILISHNTNIDFTGSDGRTALRTAAWIGRVDIALMLLAAGSDINKSDSEGRTPLMAATYKGDMKMIKLLVKNGANINHQDNDGRSAIFVAILCLNINEKHIEVIKLLIRYGSNINQVDNDDMTPLLIAAYEGHWSLCELLLEHNADIDRIDRNSRTPLMAAAFSGHYDVVKLLLFWGAAIHCIDKSGYSVLSISASQGSIPILIELLARGLDEMHRDNCGLTPLHLAATEGHIDSVNLLLNAGAKPNALDNIGRIPVMLSCQEGHIHITEILLNKWPQSIDFRSFDGSTPLKIAVLNGLSDMVAYLLERGASYTIQDNNGRTPLHIAALQSQLECLRLLLNHVKKSDYISFVDEHGRTALHMSAWKEEEEILNILIEEGCQINTKDNEGRTALHLAAWQGNLSICKTLIKFGTEVDERCSQGATSLCIAAQEGHFDICCLLINAGADVCHVDSYNRTPYKVAFKAGHHKICRILEKNGAVEIPND